MAGWQGEGRDTISWDGTIKAKNFIGDGSQLTGLSSSAVTSVFTRTGDVIAQAGDYTITEMPDLSASYAITPIVITALPDLSASYAITPIAITALPNLSASYALTPITVAMLPDLTASYSITPITVGMLPSLTASYAVTPITSAMLPNLSASYAVTPILITALPSLTASYAALSTYNAHVADATIHFASNALWAGLNAVCASAATTSTAYFAHAADASDPHGAQLTQSSLIVTNTASGGLLAVTSDTTASGAAYCRNILIGTEAASSVSAALYTQGTVYLKYTA